ncbi:MAG TPA: hypothetical protein VIQ24_09790 [Pyrinomonadaceae bacterium]
MRDQHIDSAALAGAVLAGVVAVFLQKGPYDWLNGIVSITLLAVIVGYETDRYRTWCQSVALAAVCAFCMLLLLGLILELDFGGGSLEGIIDDKGERESRVKSEQLAVAWPILTFVWCVADRNFMVRDNKRIYRRDEDGRRRAKS